MTLAISHNILAHLYKFFLFKNKLTNFLTFGNFSSLRVLLYHDIPPDKEKRFIEQLDFIRKKWNFVTPEEFSKMINNEIPVKGRNLLLSFDDGFYSNRKVAENILGPRNIKALFFVVSDFIGISNREDERKFISKNIFPGSIPSLIPVSMTGMNENDIKYLINNGHEIGSHTVSHARLSQINNLSELETEIIQSKNDIEKKFNVPIRHFAYTFGDFNSLNREALQIAKNNYDFVYTSFRGNNIKQKPWAIRRDSLKPEDSLGLSGAFLEGAADIIYKIKLKIYESWIKV